MVFSAFVTPATPRTPAGGRACGTPRLIGGLLFRPRLSADTLGFAQFPPLTSVNFAGSRYKKIPCAGASGAERTARGKKGADHRPSARRWPGYVRRGTGGASNCTNGLNYGPWTAKSAQMDLARGFARWLLRDDPDTDDGIFNTRLSIPMVGLVGGGEGKWVSGSGVHWKVVPLRAPTWGKPGNCRA